MMIGGVAQRPLMQTSGGTGIVVGQQSAAVVHLSSICEHGGGTILHIPLVQKPPQQSSPLVQVVPSVLHGVSVAKARMFPDASSCPGR